MQDVGFVPIVYTGIGQASRQSTVDRQLRDDFYRAEIAVVRLAGNFPLDNWAIPELAIHKRCLVYSCAIPEEMLEDVVAHSSCVLVSLAGLDDFRARLAADIRAALGV